MLHLQRSGFDSQLPTLKIMFISLALGCVSIVNVLIYSKAGGMDGTV